MHTFENFTACLIKALDEEIQAVKREYGSEALPLRDGRHEATVAGSHVYSFTLEREREILPDSPAGLLRVGTSSFDITVVRTESFRVTLAVADNLGPRVPHALLLVSPQHLLEALKARLGDMLHGEVAFNRNLLLELIGVGPDDNNLSGMSCHDSQTGLLNPEQQQAVRRSLTRNVSFIWGPPGTGKTWTAGVLCKALMEAGERVLVTSHTNVALDTALLALLGLVPQEDAMSGQVVRVGEAARTDTRVVEVTLRALTEQRAKHLCLERSVLKRRREDLLERLGAMGGNLEKPGAADARGKAWELQVQLEVLEARLAEIAGEIRQVEQETLSGARVVGATLCRIATTEEVYTQRVDGVLVDEASMAPLPYLWFAASRARRRVIVAGDFRQLPPIALADDPATYPNAAKWLTKDIFEQAGVLDQHKRIVRDSRVSCLKRQYRMHPAIGELANALAYGDNPLEHVGEPDGWLRASKTPPSPGRSLVFLDTSAAGPWCSRTRPGWSRFNPYSGLLSVLLARAASGGGAVGVGLITPYRSQSRLMRGFADAFGLPREQVEVATVHRLQGGEKAVVIVDLVDGHPHGAGKLLRGGFGSPAMRLLNVAFTRAQGKLVITGHASKLKASLRPGESLRAVIDHLDPRRFVPAHELLATLVEDSRKSHPRAPRGIELCNQDTFFERLLADLAAARSEVLLFTPYIRERYVKTILIELLKLSQSGVRVILVTRPPSRYDGPLESLSLLANAGARIVRRQRLTERMVFIDRATAYFGTLSMLARHGTEGFMIRLGDPHLVRPLLDATGTAHIKAANGSRDGCGKPAAKGIPRVGTEAPNQVCIQPCRTTEVES